MPVGNFVDSGAAITWESARRELDNFALVSSDRPWFVVPLLALEKSGSTPDDRKLRLCHDCGAINQHLKISRLKFNRASAADFAKSLRPGDRLISTDLASATTTLASTLPTGSFSASSSRRSCTSSAPCPSA